MERKGRNMISKFYPTEYVTSTYHIPFEKYYEEGYRGILFDVDNTLVSHGDPADDRAKELFQRLHQIGFETCVVSNNGKVRVESFYKEAGVKYFIFKARKPSSKGYLQGIEKMGTSIKDTLFVGDQIFTDIYGANRLGLKSILVQPLHPKEEIQIVIKRYIERIILYWYNKRKRS